MTIFVCGFENISLDDVVAQHDTDWFIRSEVLNQRQRGGDSTFAFLVCVVEVLKTKRLSISQQFQKISGRISASDDHDVRNAGIDQRLNRVIDHRLIENRQEMFISDRCQRLQPRSESTCEYDTFQLRSPDHLVDKSLKPQFQHQQ